MIKILAPILLFTGTPTCDKLGIALLGPALARDSTELTLANEEGLVASL